MRLVIVRNIAIGEGMPKICVPIVGKTETEILDAAAEISKSSADLLEWRADWYEDLLVAERVKHVLEEMRHIVADIPILFTIRTSREGGERDINAMQYAQILSDAMDVGVADMIDIEVYSMSEVAPDLIAKAHTKGLIVVGSNHDFAKTPAKEDLIQRLCHMQDLGVDLPKIAVMPQCEDDVETLLQATLEMARNYADRPIVTMSMSELGVRSRTEGEIYGSTMTFGVIGKASAPGQLAVTDLKHIMEKLHALQSE